MRDSPVLPPVRYAIDVECVATGPTHNDRAVAQVAVVDQHERVVLNIYVKPPTPVFAYLTALTGVTKEHVENEGISLAEAVERVRQVIPSDAVLVGQNVRQDVLWLEGLKEGTDFAALMDLQGLYRVWNARYKSYSMWSQDQLCRVLLGQHVTDEHDAVGDALKSIRLFHQFFHLQDAGPEAWGQACEALLAAPVEMSFARKNPTFEGVCMGNRKTCACGAPFFS